MCLFLQILRQGTFSSLTVILCCPLDVISSFVYTGYAIFAGFQRGLHLLSSRASRKQKMYVSLHVIYTKCHESFRVLGYTFLVLLFSSSFTPLFRPFRNLMGRKLVKDPLQLIGLFQRKFMQLVLRLLLQKMVKVLNCLLPYSIVC